MTKVITSPVDRWPGTITLPDYLSFPQEAEWEDAIEAAGGEELALIDAASKPRPAMALLPAILGIVQEWRLEGFPEYPTLDTFPATPKLSSARLLAWIIGEIAALYEEAITVPLAD